MTNFCCENCIFHNDKPGDMRGECRRHAPRVSIVGFHDPSMGYRQFDVTNWPQTENSDWCGEGLPK